MENYSSEQPGSSKAKSLPRQQAYLLLAILFGYPLLSIAMGLAGATSPENITSRINQIYLPSLFVQCVMLLAVWLILLKTRSTFNDIGLGKSDINFSNALAGVIFFIGAASVIIIIKSAIERSGHLPEKDIIYILPVTLTEKIIWVILSLGAAFAEEITFRGYTISRLKVVTGGYWIGVLLSSFAFSIGHLYQGLAGVLLTFIYGLLFAGLFVARRSVFPCIVAHFLQDVMILIAFRGPG